MKQYLKVNKKAYDQLAVEYAYRKKNYTESDRKITKSFTDYLIKRFERLKILDIGPGSGLNLSMFGEEGFQTSAIDISEKVIQVAQETSPATLFHHGEFLGYDFRNVLYQGIFAKAFIHLFPKQEVAKVLEKMYGLLVEGGMTFIGTTMHDRPEEGYVVKEGYPGEVVRYRKRWTQEELSEELSRSRFSIHSQSFDTEEQLNKRWMHFLLVK